MAAKCKKCDPHEICEECPEWIFTLADLIMCMMGLFVLLWVLNVSNKSPTPASAAATAAEAKTKQEKLIEQVAAIRKAFKYEPDPGSSDPVDQWMIEHNDEVFRGAKGKGTQIKDEATAEGVDPLTTTIRESKFSIVGSRVMFRQGSAEVTPAEGRVLDEIAEKVKGSRLVIVLKGHASRDDLDEHAKPQAFLDLSLRRAQAAADYLTQRGVSPDLLRVQGCSTYEPVKQRAYSADEHAANRRVEVFSTDVAVRDLQDPHDTAVKPVD